MITTFYKKNIFIFLLLTSILVSKSSSDIQKEINTNNRTLKKLEDSINKLESDINTIKNSEKDLNNYLDILNQKIDYREKQIAILIQQDQSISNLILKSENNILIKEQKLTDLKAQLSTRSQYLYKHGKKSIISKIMLSENWNQALTKMQYLKTILKYEKQLNTNIKSKIKELKIERDILKKDKNRQKKILNDAKDIYKKLEQNKKDKSSQIQRIKKDKNILQDNLLAKRKEMSDMEKIIKKLITDVAAAKKREQDLINIRAQQNKATSGNFAKMKGRLDWPTEGKIITKFGIQTNRILNTQIENIGINIQANKNANVYSVLDGVVSVITYIRNYGNTIIVSHGSGYYTVYANIENITVSEEQYILGNTKLANVAKSENPSISSSYFLHFEIWKDETKLNPEIWLK